MIDSSCEVPRGEKMLYSGTDPESYITEYTLVYEDKYEFVDVGTAQDAYVAPVHKADFVLAEI